ncbi:cytochrome P450 monooxygenase [Histoplasma capsulatum var. duboisii H88]|uniref:Cytochrome P450 monooxygenase n=1 Tax=Ajellomyces capsulatus (strain H88) TaxID=544711 RepID=A0A8A1LBB0_AJEC8|nr:cytochrome P450 monooxygenase [Histoplasma capsulatum var. duboisii H88]
MILPSVPPNATSACLGVFCLLLIVTAAKVVNRLFLSPFRKVPGPILAKLTGGWLLCVDLAGRRAMKVHELHEKYGSVVQLGPNELSFSSAESIGIIYGTGTRFRKAPMYMTMGRPGVLHLSDPAAHRERRRLLNHAFSKQHLDDMEPEFRNSVKKMVARMERQGGEALDMKHWFKMYTLDNAGKAFLGATFGGLDSDESPRYVKDFDLFLLAWAFKSTFPIPAWFVQKIPHPKIKFVFDAEARIYQYGIDRFNEYIEKYGRVSQRRDLLTKMIGRKENDPDALADSDIAVEISNLCFAATDTTGTALVYLFWELARNPHLAERLRSELADLPLVDGVIQHQSVSNVPFLEALIMEGLRAYPPLPSGLLREAPVGGCAIDGIYVPQGTIASTHTWTTHHSPEYFPHPDKFDPSRWLEGNVCEGMKKLWMPFSKGPRNCMGRTMGLFEMKILIATLVRRFHISIDNTMRDDAMDITDHFLLIPKGDKCLLRFTPI